MTQFTFDKEKISQHIVKYGVDIRPTVEIKADKAKLTPYCERLTEQFPHIFETVLSGPDRLQIQKAFLMSQNNKIELPTLVFTGRGPVFTLPIRIRAEDVEDFDLPNKERVIMKALKQIRRTLAGRRVPRFGVVNEIIFDCGMMNSVEVIADALSKLRWKSNLTGVKIHLQNPKNGNNINLDIEPVVTQQVQYNNMTARHPPAGYGIRIKVDINNRDMSGDLNETQVQGILGFANSYVSDELFSFLNNE